MSQNFGELQTWRPVCRKALKELITHRCLPVYLSLMEDKKLQKKDQQE